VGLKQSSRFVFTLDDVTVLILVVPSSELHHKVPSMERLSSRIMLEPAQLAQERRASIFRLAFASQGRQITA
jgi:hypothetical protein